MVPALGGRVIGLKSRRSGRQWCWHQERPDWLWRNSPGDSFGLSTQAGIDECLPTVEGCVWRGRVLPDHGELWTCEWKLDPHELSLGRLSATVPLSVMPFTFCRTISADDGGGFVFDYSLTNRGPRTEEFMWCLHPLFALVDGDQLVLPAEVLSLRLNGGIADRPANLGDTWDYPEPITGFRLDRMQTPGMPHGCVKGFTEALSDGIAAIENGGTGDRLELSWEVRAAPYLGLWLNRGHSGFHHVALEPTNAAPDSLLAAVDSWKRFGSITSGKTLCWRVRFRLA